MNSKRTSKRHPSRTPERDKLFPIVGIGASAGGLEAFTELLSHLPLDTGMAFVLVQHLDPDQKSLLSEILSRSTRLPVREVEDGMTVEPDRVYAIPSNTVMTIESGVLHLRPRENRRISMSVDIFLSSLAADRGDRAIGVILSGADSDGSRGLDAIKAAGGITFAQSEDSARVSSMPNTAIATGHVDFILPPAEIAEKLAIISRHPYVTSPISAVPPAESPDGKDPLATIFGLLRAATRVDFTHYKHTTLKRRIFRRMALYRQERLEDYVRYLQENPAEVRALYQEILINVTSFFRDAGAFSALKQKVFPALTRGRSPEFPLRIWVAGCSTGEEAYSIAICLLEFLARQPRKPPIQIFATDVSEDAIEKARLGIYSPNQVADVSPGRLQRFFTRVDGNYQINKSVRELCIFARQNLIGDPPFSRLDLISCRNVFIYFGASLQKKVLSLFHYGLVPEGFLLLGTSESAGETPDLFTPIDRKYKIYSKNPVSGRLNLDLLAGNYPAPIAGDRSVAGEVSHDELELHTAADRIVLQQYAPVGAIVNADMEILQFRGQTGAYLEPSPGRASLNLLNMAREELRMELLTAFHQAKQEGQVVHREVIATGNSNSTHPERSVPPRRVRIDVIPFKPTETGEDYFLVLFADLSSPVTAADETAGDRRRRPAKERTDADRSRIQQLQRELGTTKAYLQSIIEEQRSTNQDLRAANEEILSSNEELQSTNEELQTAKEEIQATNEELGTINDELYRRNAETSKISNDFQNLLGSIHIPILMLEGDLRIRRFTATAAPLFNLISTDIGRPLSDIKHNLQIDNLEQQILAVIDTLEPNSREIQTLDGHWYDLRIRPYRTLDNLIDGAVVVLVDIDILKRVSEQLRDARDYAEAIVETVRESLVVLNANFEVVTANRAFYETFRVSPLETEHCRFFDLGNGQWNLPALRSLFEDLLARNGQIQNFEVEYDFERVGRKKMSLNARGMPLVEGRQLILLAIEEIRDRPAIADGIDRG
ncbi:chemotaxis protein CheB [Pannus brasiliensis CCIBt3594]|uniref:Chemotaxis protein CheB n=1 Tax=Pannus brasiliensis CCIBt3594 TaxID=1427578 RepID=A0AAW9QLT1_9CHRO